MTQVKHPSVVWAPLQQLLQDRAAKVSMPTMPGDTTSNPLENNSKKGRNNDLCPRQMEPSWEARPFACPASNCSTYTRFHSSRQKVSTDVSSRELLSCLS